MVGFGGGREKRTGGGGAQNGGSLEVAWRLQGGKNNKIIMKIFVVSLGILLVSAPSIQFLSLPCLTCVQRITTRKQNLTMANIHQENEEMEQPLQNGQEERPLGGGDGHQPAANNHNRRGQARRLAPNFRWAIPNRQINDGMGGDGDDMEMFMEEMREIRRKLRELQLRNCLRILMGELSNHHDHHDEFCLMP